jgi:pSer/pThr/pTyr-binding forkhead associated (FHA) protein
MATADTMELVSVKADGGDGASWTIWPGSVVTVGAKTGQLRFPNDRFVSDPHARCRRLGDHLEVADMNSRNGIYTRIKDNVHVYPGDMFLMGHHLFRLANLPSDAPPHGPGEAAWFGTPAAPPWGRVVLIGAGGVDSNVYDLRDSSVVIGREDCHIAFSEDRFMSRRHAKVELRSMSGGIGVFLEDLGSANGTYLRVRNQTTLAEGDMLRIGDQLLRFSRARA